MRVMKSVYLAVVLAGCGVTSTFTPINTPPRALQPRDPGAVEIYTAGPPPRSRVDVGQFQAGISTVATADPFGDMLAALRKQAAAMGCDALFVQRSSEKFMVATCGVYTDGMGSPPPAGPLPPAAAAPTSPP